MRNFVSMHKKENFWNGTVILGPKSDMSEELTDFNGKSFRVHKQFHPQIATLDTIHTKY